MKGLISCGVGNNEEIIGQRMTAFTAGIWTALRDHAPGDSEFQYTLQYDRKKRPNRCITDSETLDDSSIVVRSHGLLICAFS